MKQVQLITFNFELLTSLMQSGIVRRYQGRKVEHDLRQAQSILEFGFWILDKVNG